MLGAGAWVYPWKKGDLDKWRVFYRVEPGGPLVARVKATKRDAEAFAEEMRGLIVNRRRTVDDALDEYKRDMGVRGLREKSIKNATRDLRTVLADVLDAPLTVLTPRKADALYGAIAASGKYKPGTHHLMLKACRAFGEWCAHRRRKWLKANPFAEVERIGEADDYRSESLRVDEARAFRETALALAQGGDEGAVAALIALVCSLRPSEIRQLAVRDVDDGGAVLHVAGATLKTANTRRAVEVADGELRALLVARAAGKTPTDRLFAGHRDSWLADAARRIAEAAGVPLVDARTLRRTFVSLAARRGRSLDEVAFAAGHGADAQARTASRYYAAPGAVQSGIAARAFGVLDGGRGRKK